MQRREFLKGSMITATGMLLLPSLTYARKDNDQLAELFENPPASAKPLVYWIWQNGHISKEGITSDLETMKQMGLGGAMLFNTEGALPRGLVDMGTPEWTKLVVFTMQEAQRLGLRITLHNSPGFSGTSGSFVTPEQSMQQLVFRQISINGKTDKHFIPQPYTKLGYYKDIAVLAFPEERIPVVLRNFWLNGKIASHEKWWDHDPETAVRLEKEGSLVFEFSTVFKVQSITIWRKPEVPGDIYGGPPDNPPILQLECSVDGTAYKPVCAIPMPQLRKMNAPGAAIFPPVEAKFFRLSTNTSTWIADLSFYQMPHLRNWPGKANFYQHVKDTGPKQEVDLAQIIPQSMVIDITDKLQPDGSLNWEPPAGSIADKLKPDDQFKSEAPVGNWTILRIGHTATGQPGASQPDAAAGLEIDKFSRTALNDWFRQMDTSLYQQLAPYTGKSFEGIIVDSWEVGVQNWTIEMPQEFLQRRKYPLTQWLPALTGCIIESVEATEQFLLDFRITQAALVAEYYYGGFKEHCAKRGLVFRGEPYGDGMFDSIQIAQPMDLPMGEFWTRYAPGSMNAIGMAISAGHMYGKQVIGAEAFTGLPETSRWTEYPYALKAQGDHFFAIGINQLVLHAFVHQAYNTGFPGLTFGPFGTHFDRNNSWTAFASGWTDYLTRAQFLLQQGHYAADFAFFLGEEPAAFIPDIDHVSPSKPSGYGADVIGPNALQQDLRIENGDIVLPDGMRYKVLVIIQTTIMSVAVLEKLTSLVQQGMLLAVNEKPIAAPGKESNTARVKQLADALWGDLDGEHIKERNYGKGKVYRGRSLTEILPLPPDFTFTSLNRDAAIHFTHRRLGSADIYFVCNHLRRVEKISAQFRVTGMQPEIWNAEDGSITDAILFEPLGDTTRVALELSPAGSCFVIFRKPLKEKYAIKLEKNSQLIDTAALINTPAADLNRQVQQTFSITVWLKPDTYTMPGKGYVIYPAEGETVYGKGYATCGLRAGQNVVRICERDKGSGYFSKDVVASYQPVEGWTHVAIVYTDGSPALYVNSVLVGKAAASGNIIIPGLGTKPTGELYSGAFEGNSTEPILYREALSAAKIASLYAAGVPPPQLPQGVTLTKRNGKTTALVWENGTFRLGAESFHAKDGCAVRPVYGAWQLRAGDTAIQLRDLISLRKHKVFDIRHFSGTAIYSKNITVLQKDLQKNKQIFLDLGRVEVAAKVFLNGKEAGLLWKEPYRLDVTAFVKAGVNQLKVEVATLWPNRQIGDEYYPKENAYNPYAYIEKMPDWFVNNKPKPGARKTFATWNNYKVTDPLLDSGLLGPVRLITAVTCFLKGSL